MISPSFPTELLEASAESALDAVARAGDRGSDLVTEWVKAGNAGAVEALARLGTGQSKKTARRGLNVLKARGIRFERQHHVANLSPTSEKELVEARMIAPDSAGNLVLVITAKSPSSRVRTAFVVLSDHEGLHNVQTGELSQSQLKEAIGRALPGNSSRPASVSVEWARYRIAQARKVHEARGAPLPLGTARARDLLEPVPEEAVEHPFDEEGLVLSDEDASDQAKLSRELHSLPEFQNWLPARESVDELLAKVGEHFAPGEQPEQSRLMELVDNEIAAATDRYFTPARRQEVVAAMKDAALCILQREGETRALGVVGAMAVIEKAGLITNSPSEIPFLRAFFEKAISFLLAQGRGQLRIPVGTGARSVDSGDAEERRWGVPAEATEAPSSEPPA